MHRAVYGSRQASSQASSCISHVLTRGRIAARVFNTDVGGGLATGAGAGGAATGAGDGAATGTDFVMGT